MNDAQIQQSSRELTYGEKAVGISLGVVAVESTVIGPTLVRVQAREQFLNSQNKTNQHAKLD